MSGGGLFTVCDRSWLENWALSDDDGGATMPQVEEAHTVPHVSLTSGEPLETLAKDAADAKVHNLAQSCRSRSDLVDE